MLVSNFEYHANVFGRSRDYLIERARKYRKATEEFSSTVADELRGAADSSGISPEEIYVLAAFCELIYPPAPRATNHCTSFAVRNGATSDGLTYVGQNDDESINPWLGGEECVTVVRYVPDNGSEPRVLAYSYAGVPAQMGINSQGLAVCINALHYDRAREEDGVPMWCLVRETLNQKNVEDAIELIRETRRAYSLNFVLGDTKQIADLETTPESVTVTLSDEMLYHSNHYLYSTDPRIGPQDTAGFQNTKLRLQRITDLMEPMNGRFNLETLESFLGDHGNRPDSICCHSGERPSNPDGRTFDGMIYIPEKREAWITRGNPCQNEFIRYDA